ncbi:MAG: leucine-rich repeat domain-containing protein [Clostridia bacterium]|nr:leucine-rich repeat domain-containing protein [Clostridia bacterium]
MIKRKYFGKYALTALGVIGTFMATPVAVHAADNTEIESSSEETTKSDSSSDTFTIEAEPSVEYECVSVEGYDGSTIYQECFELGSKSDQEINEIVDRAILTQEQPEVISQEEVTAAMNSGKTAAPAEFEDEDGDPEYQGYIEVYDTNGNIVTKDINDAIAQGYVATDATNAEEYYNENNTDKTSEVNEINSEIETEVEDKSETEEVFNDYDDLEDEGIINSLEDTITLTDNKGNVVGTIDTDGKLVVKSTGVEKSYSQANGYAAWTDYNDYITSVEIEDGTKVIGQNAFIYLDNVTEITVPNSVTTISSYAFGNMAKLGTVILGEGVSKIDEKAFHRLPSLETVYMPGNAIYFADNIFNKCGSEAEPVRIVTNENSVAAAYAKASGTLYEDIAKDHSKEATIAKEMYSPENDIDVSGTFETNGYKYSYAYNVKTKTLDVYADKKNTPIKYTKIKNNDYDTDYKWCDLRNAVETLNISKNIASVEANAFSGFWRLKDVNCSSDLEEITAYAFNKSDNIDTLTFKSAVKDPYDTFQSSSIKNIEVYKTGLTEEDLIEILKEFDDCDSFHSRSVNEMNNLSIIPVATQGSKHINSMTGPYNVSWYDGRTNYACVVTSAAMMIERKSYLDGATATKGNFDQVTVDNLIQEMCDDYSLVNINWDFCWTDDGSFDTLKLNNKPYKVQLASTAKTEDSNFEVLDELLKKHPEGVIGYCEYYNAKGILNAHAVLVIGKSGSKYKIYDPAYGELRVNDITKLNGNSNIISYRYCYIKN